MRLLPVALALLAIAGPISGAAAYAPPELRLRELNVSDQPVGPWLDLVGASLGSAYGYELGIVLEQSGQHVLVELTSVPEGASIEDQREVYSLCFEQTGTPGEVVDLDQRIRYAGNGTYGVRMTVSDSPDASSACETANPASAEGSFTVDAQTSIRRIGVRPFTLNTLVKEKLAGYAIDLPDRGQIAELLCATKAVRQPDGSLKGAVTKTLAGEPDPRARNEPFVTDFNLLPQPGVWTCVGRQDKGAALVQPPWSEPSKPELVREVWYGINDPALPDGRGPRFRITGRAEPYMAGATVSFRILRSRCGKRLREVTVARSRVSRTGKVSFRFRLPRLKKRETVAIYQAQSNLKGSKLIVPHRRSEPNLALGRQGGKPLLGGTLQSCA